MLIFEGFKARSPITRGEGLNHTRTKVQKAYFARMEQKSI